MVDAADTAVIAANWLNELTNIAVDIADTDRCFAKNEGIMNYAANMGV